MFFIHASVGSCWLPVNSIWMVAVGGNSTDLQSGSHAAHFYAHFTYQIDNRVIPMAATGSSSSGGSNNEVAPVKVIEAGSPIPAATLHIMTGEGPGKLSSQELFAGKKVVLFALPGAFTPTCSERHLPGYLARHDELKAAGADVVACLTVNDIFVVDAWAKQHGAADLTMLSDGSAEFTQALGLQLDLSHRGFGVRSDRYLMIVDNGIVTHLQREQPGELNVSTAEAALEILRG